MATVPTKEASPEADDYTLPPFLRRVQIRGYKSMAFCNVRLQPLTILVGRNAAGKSNFLDALAFVRDVMKVGVAPAVNFKSRGGWSSMVCRSSAVPKIEIEIEAAFTCGRPFQLISGNSSPLTALPPKGGQVPDLTGKSFTATYSLEFAIAPHSAPIISRESLEIADETHQLSGGFEVQNGIIQRWRSKPNSSAPLGLPHSSELLSAQRSDFPLLSVIGTQPFVDLGEGLRSMTFYNFHPDAIRGLSQPTPGQMLDKSGYNLASVLAALKEIDPEALDRVRDYLRVVAPEIEDFHVIRLGEYETIRFRTHRGLGEAPLEFTAGSMSDGTLRVLAALAAAFQVVLPHGYPSVVGIEEPENALHPAAMRALVDALDDATQRTQIILTSHSGDLLSERDVNPAQVLVVRNQGGQTQITPVNPASRKIIEKELYSLADLQRMDKLDIDEADLKRQMELSRNGGA